jgi:hypothetical protein
MIVAAVSFAINFIPLLIFDFRHQFLNSKLFLNFFFTEKNISTDKNVWFFIFQNAFWPVFFLKSTKMVILFYFFIIITLLLLINKKKDFYRKFFISFLGIWLITPLVFSFYGKRPSEYYFFFLYPFIFITIIEFFLVLKKDWILIIYCFFLLCANFFPLKKTLESYDFGLYYKEKAVKKLIEVVDQKKKFNISYNMPLGLNNGYNYLIDYYQFKQSGDFRHPLVELRVPAQNDDIKVGKIGLKVPKEVLK